MLRDVLSAHLLHGAETENAVLLRNWGTAAADVADFGLNAVPSAGRAADGTLALECVEDLRADANGQS